MEFDETKIQRQVEGSTSLRTTIPRHIAKAVELEFGDEVTWYTQLDDDGSTLAVFKKKP